MPWFNKPLPESTHEFVIPKGSIIKSKNGKDDIELHRDMKIGFVVEFDMFSSGKYTNIHLITNLNSFTIYV